MNQRVRIFPWIAVAGVIILIVLIPILMIASPDVFWIILSVSLVLFLPGFALTLILFPPKSLGMWERLLLSVALSVVFTALSGLVLNLTPWGLQVDTLLIILLSSVAMEIVIVLIARRNWWTGQIELPSGLIFNPRQWVLMSLAALLTVAAVSEARTPAPQQGLTGYTILWIDSADTPDRVLVRVQCEEFKPTYYQIKYERNGRVQGGPTFILQPGETWERTVPIQVSNLEGSSLTVLLYRLENPTEVYRRVVWWPDSTRQEP